MQWAAENSRAWTLNPESVWRRSHERRENRQAIQQEDWWQGVVTPPHVIAMTPLLLWRLCSWRLSCVFVFESKWQRANFASQFPRKIFASYHNMTTRSGRGMVPAPSSYWCCACIVGSRWLWSKIQDSFRVPCARIVLGFEQDWCFHNFNLILVIIK